MNSKSPRIDAKGLDFLSPVGGSGAEALAVQ
jgi:hypothetical protein